MPELLSSHNQNVVKLGVNRANKKGTYRLLFHDIKFEIKDRFYDLFKIILSNLYLNK